MKRTICLISSHGMEGWWGETILTRQDFEVLFTDNYKEGFQLLLKNKCQLVVAEDWPGCEYYQTFLSELQSAVRSESLKVVLITNSIEPGQLAPPLEEVLPFPTTVFDFNRVVAKAMNLPIRASRRHLVRLFLQVGGECSRSLGMAVTVKANAGGMMIESHHQLPMGKTCLWSFMGVNDLKDLMIPGTIFLEETNCPTPKVRRYIVRFDEDAHEERQILGEYLSKNF